MIILFSDFGSSDIYVGQVKAVLAQSAPGVQLLDLLHDAPNFQIQAAAHLLAASFVRMPQGSVFLAVVDPGVGGQRQPVVMEADGQYFVAPDNGLLSVVAARASYTRFWRIDWRPESSSSSFHGRDLFAPIAAAIAGGAFPKDKLSLIEQLDVRLSAEALFEVIYVDHYGNAMTGVRAGSVPQHARLEVGGQVVQYARTFSQAQAGAAFWHENSFGLIEIAVNCGSAAQVLNLAVGQTVSVGYRAG
jgi:hypothetical protein